MTPLAIGTKKPGKKILITPFLEERIGYYPNP